MTFDKQIAELNRTASALGDELLKLPFDPMFWKIVAAVAVMVMIGAETL